MEKKTEDLLKEYQEQINVENNEVYENAHCCGLSDRQCTNICCLAMCASCCDGACSN